jgi:predicted GNAT family acetyltransferase
VAGHNADDRGSKSDRDLDETLQETFPASDAPANTVETGIGSAGSPSADQVHDNPAAHRFELTIDDKVAFLVYDRTPVALTLVHTEVPASLRGRHIGDMLVEAALNAGRSAGLRIVAVCPFVRTYLRRHPDANSPA